MQEKISNPRKNIPMKNLAKKFRHCNNNIKVREMFQSNKHEYKDS
jgi:hypothetical protein